MSDELTDAQILPGPDPVPLETYDTYTTLSRHIAMPDHVHRDDEPPLPYFDGCGCTSRTFVSRTPPIRAK